MSKALRRVTWIYVIELHIIHIVHCYIINQLHEIYNIVYTNYMRDPSISCRVITMTQTLIVLFSVYYRQIATNRPDC